MRRTNNTPTTSFSLHVNNFVKFTYIYSKCRFLILVDGDVFVVRAMRERGGGSKDKRARGVNYIHSLGLFGLFSWYFDTVYTSHLNDRSTTTLFNKTMKNLVS